MIERVGGTCSTPENNANVVKQLEHKRDVQDVGFAFGLAGVAPLRSRSVMQKHPYVFKIRIVFAVMPRTNVCRECDACFDTTIEE